MNEDFDEAWCSRCGGVCWYRRGHYFDGRPVRWWHEADWLWIGYVVVAAGLIVGCAVGLAVTT